MWVWVLWAARSTHPRAPTHNYNRHKHEVWRDDNDSDNLPKVIDG